ncbi:DUF2243 domain-containing protein [Metabacillus malikii]|nr:DUF2243 domain-containing protein [Metabacillus malikii]
MKDASKSVHYRNFWSGFLLGVGFVAFFDEAVFHQLLHWHHFYDKSITTIGLISDGFFHAFSWFATVYSLYMMAILRQEKQFLQSIWWGSILLGVGIFQLYDGIIQHKIMRIHQIRYHVDIFMYDIVWNAAAILFIIVGGTIVRTYLRITKMEGR